MFYPHALFSMSLLFPPTFNAYQFIVRTIISSQFAIVVVVTVVVLVVVIFMVNVFMRCRGK